MNAAEKMSRRDELEALLPFYLNGTLEGPDLVAVEDWLATDPAAGVALAEAETELFGSSAANDAIRPPTDALARFTKALDAEAGPVRAPAAPSLLTRAWTAFMGVPIGVAWAAAAALLALIVVQAVTGPERQGGGIEIAGSEDDLTKMPFALVKFKADARMADVTAFLSQNRLVVISGPNGDGVFRLGIPAETAADYDRLFGLIAAQPFAEAVLQGRKPANDG